ncbi:hypothetical protein B0T24DRAFT_593301 [Lasiosphaeria ovina]|uniref:Uncharacterized protein n=1 Tax=Lasiosphaeria ovina TaxID=92902 RepID=A0AAE0N6Y0_9PEZI|nr:hypothetical protein B0T24DRAFT_593301 [Lasiosphaeria ovina]
MYAPAMHVQATQPRLLLACGLGSPVSGSGLALLRGWPFEESIFWFLLNNGHFNLHIDHTTTQPLYNFILEIMSAIMERPESKLIVDCDVAYNAENSFVGKRAGNSYSHRRPLFWAVQSATPVQARYAPSQCCTDSSSAIYNDKLTSEPCAAALRLRMALIAGDAVKLDINTLVRLLVEGGADPLEIFQPDFLDDSP